MEHIQVEFPYIQIRQKFEFLHRLWSLLVVISGHSEMSSQFSSKMAGGYIAS
jgi:hypothetical protein